MGIGNIGPDADTGQNRACMGMALISGGSGQVSVFAPMARWLERLPGQSPEKSGPAGAGALVSPVRLTGEPRFDVLVPA